MGYSWGEHVGELELRLDGPDERAVFESAVAAFAELLGDGGEHGAREWFDVAADGGDRATLLAAWLEELVFLAEQHGFVPVAVQDMTLEDASIRARVGGYRGEPPHLVKAVTYHRLSFAPDNGGWRANVVLDV